MLDDASVLAELAGSWIRRPDATKQPAHRYTAVIVGLGDRQLDVELNQNCASVRTWIALPESLRPQPWLVEQESADDPEDWVSQLREWLDEEMYSAGLGPAYLRLVADGHSRLVVDGYGFRSADERRHQRLRRSVGPHGWHVEVRKGQIRRQYAAEWALDQVEQQLRQVSSAELLDPDGLEWSLTSGEGVAVFVEADAELSGDRSTDVVLTAQAGPKGGPHGRRRLSRSV